MRFLIPIVFILVSFTGYSQIIYSENFEPRDGYLGGIAPDGWTQEFEHKYEDWFYQEGGHSHNPDTAADGIYNAIFQVESYENERTKLILPPIDLSVANTPRLTFWHVQDSWFWLGNYNNDELRVYYKTSFLGNWKLLKSYTSAIEVWTEQEIYLPPTDLSGTYYIAFEGKTGYGHGVCIDNVQVEETGTVDKQVTNFAVEQASTEFIATNTDYNPILRMPMRVQGNSGSLTLNNLTVTSLNTDDTDLKAGGVKLWLTETPTFSNPTQLGGNVDFSGGEAVFSSIGAELPYGYIYLWLTYDIKADALHGHNFDAKITADAVVLSNGTFPVSDESPSGLRTIFETLYYQDFETDYSDWNISSGFEVGTPSGLGGIEGGSPDPDYAVSGVNVLGNGVVASNDLEALYANDLTDSSEYAVTPILDLTYYTNTILRFDQWLNIEGWDKAHVYYSTDGSKTWKTLWTNAGTFLNESKWKSSQFAVSNLVDRKNQVSFRFSLGSTTSDTRYSGWNIDNFVLVANFIDTDVGVVAWEGPSTGCGMSNANTVKAYVKNFAGVATNKDIPIGYSLDGGTSWEMDVVTDVIPLADSVLFTFSVPADLSTPGVYTPIIKTFLDGDEDTDNDSFSPEVITSIPAYTIPYDNDFESGADYWLESGANSSWQLGKPSGLTVKNANSGTNAWMTGLVNNFGYDDSSMVTSPCFDFSGIEDPVFDFATIVTFEEDIAGASLQYSLDTGKTWNVVPKDADKWNWYTDDVIPVLQTEFGVSQGWASPSGDWQQSKEYLPKTFMNENAIMFRIIFASESTGLPTDGFGFDDVRIYNAPPDVGVTAFTAPVSACELSGAEAITVTIQNYGIDTLEIGDEVIIGLDLNSSKHSVDTFLMTENVLPGATFSYTYATNVDMSFAGDFDLRAYTLMKGDVDFYDETTNNDTSEITISVYGMPNYDLGPDFGSETPSSVILDAGAGFTSYLWTGGATTQTYNIPSAGTYKVTVTNAAGCQADDSLTVILSAKDIVVNPITSPTSACVISVPQTVDFTFTNNHNHTFQIGDKLYFGYTVNGGEEVVDSTTLTATFAKTESLPFSFTEKVDITDTGSYTIRVFSILSDDINLSNDTAQLVVEHWGLPNIDFGRDTIYTLEPDTLTLAVAGSYANYEWQDASSSPEYAIIEYESQWYKLTVTADHSCGTAKDSVYISANDIELGSIISPVTSCSLTASETISAVVYNYGNDVLVSGSTIELHFSINGGAWQQDDIILTEDLYPSENITIESTTLIDLSVIGTHQIDMYIYSDGDGMMSNNGTSLNIDVYGYPIVDLGVDTVLAHEDTLPSFDATVASPTATYQWNDIFFSTTGTLNVVNPQNWKYIVAVTDNGCTTTDSVYVFTDNFSIDNSSPDIAFCELGNAEQLKTTIKNTTSNIYQIGTQLDVSYSVNGGALVTELFTLTEVLPQLGTVDYSFVQKADLSLLDEYTITYSVDYPTEVYIKDNSLEAAAKAIGYPSPDFGYGDTIFTTQPDTIELWLDQEYDTYEWHDGGTYKDVFYVSASTPEYYKVTVSLDPGCYGSDSVFVKTFDVALTDILSPQDNCTSDGNSTVSVRVQNNFSTTILAGDSLFLSYNFLDSTYIDTLVLESDFLPLESFNYTYDDTLQIDSTKAYNLTCSILYKSDAVASNNEQAISFSIHGNPEIDLGIDTIFTTRADTLVLDAGLGFAFYNWNTGESDQAIVPAYLHSYNYKVTAADFNVCYASDSVQIIATDLSIDSVLTPIDSCSLGNASISFIVENTGNDTVHAGTKLPVMVTVDKLVSFTDTIVLDTILVSAKDTIFLDTSLDLSNFDTVTLGLNIQLAVDINESNDSISHVVKSTGNPTVSLNVDTLYLALDGNAKVFTIEEYDRYEWSTSALSDTITLTGADIGWTYVTAYDVSGCSGVDSVAVFSKDMSFEFVSELSDCELSSNTSIDVICINNGANTTSNADTLFLQLFSAETLLLTDTVFTTVNSLDTLHHTFSETFDFSDSTSVSLRGVLVLDNDVLASNNEDVLEVVSYGFPTPQIGEDSLFTILPDTVSLKTIQTYTSYNWSGGITDEVFSVSSNASKWYFVTVTDDNGCDGVDSIFILTNDLSITEIVSPKTACFWNDAEDVTVALKNTGVEIYTSGESIILQLRVEDTVHVQDTLVLDTDFDVDDTLEYTFSRTLDLIDVDEVTMSVALIDRLEVESSNDSYLISIQENGNPAISFDQPLYITSRVDTLQFEFSNTYSYTWNTGSSSSSLSPEDTVKALYIVTASDDIGCETIDSVTVFATDISIKTDESIKSACSLSSSESPSLVFIADGGTGIVESDSIYINVEFEGSITTILLDKDLLASDTVLVDFGTTVDLEQENGYALSYSVSTQIDGEDHLILQTVDSIYNYGYPDVSFAEDTVKHALPVDISITGGYTYNWSNGTSSATASISQSGWHYLTTTNEYGCYEIDSVLVYGYDLAIDSVVFPLEDAICKKDLSHYPQLIVRNNGLDTIDNTMPLIVKVGEYIDTLFVENLNPTETTTITPRNNLLSTPDDYTVSISVQFENDIQIDNGVIEKDFTILNNPYFEFYSGYDSIQGSRPPFKMTGPDGYSYKWSTDETTQIIDAMSEGWYSLEISDDNGCAFTDSIYLMLTNPGDPNTLITLNNSLVEVYPTVFNEIVTISSDEVITSIKFYSETGVLILEQTPFNEKINLDVKTSHLAVGKYFIVVEMKDKRAVYKLLKE